MRIKQKNINPHPFNSNRFKPGVKNTFDSIRFERGAANMSKMEK